MMYKAILWPLEAQMRSTAPNNGLKTTAGTSSVGHLCPTAASFKSVTSVPEKSAVFKPERATIV